MRMTLACERCRTKKVRCDFQHPTCGRCENLKVSCSYTGTSTQIDIFNLVQLNETITKLNSKVETVEHQLQSIQHDTQIILREINPNNSSNNSKSSKSSNSSSSVPLANCADRDRTLIPTELKTNWALSLTTTGLRIDTNIFSLQDLYTILLSGASEFQRQSGHDLSNSSTRPSSPTAQQQKSPTTAEKKHPTSGHRPDIDDELSPSLSASPTPIPLPPLASPASPSSSSSKLADHVIVAKSHPLYRSKGIIFPLYSAWESTHHQHQQMQLPNLSHTPSLSSSLLSSYTPSTLRTAPTYPNTMIGGYNHDNSSMSNIKVTKQSSTPMMDGDVIGQLLQHYAECFLCYPLPDIDVFLATCRQYLQLQQQQRNGKRKRSQDTGKNGDHSGNSLVKINLLLVNAILAWSARHAAIYHGMFSGQDPNTVGEYYFDQAKELLRDCFLLSTLDTVHALLLMYIYSIGKTGTGRAQAESEAYVFLGLAIRMAMDMGLHQKYSTSSAMSTTSPTSTVSGSPTSTSSPLPFSSVQSPAKEAGPSGISNNLMDDDLEHHNNHHDSRPSGISFNMKNCDYRREENENDPVLLEKQRRLFAAIEFMETLCASHSDKPMMLPSTDDVTTSPPTRMMQEQGEQRYRVEFTIHRHQISQIDRTIHDTILSSVSNPRLSSISHLEQRLKGWYRNLPSYFQYDRHRNWRSTSFREQACLKLTFEYHFQMCQLYSMFLPRLDELSGSLSAIALLSLRICVEAADSITELLEHWAELEQPWCHFTLGTLVMACGVYSSYQLRNPSSEVVATTKRQMIRIHTVLKTSPVRHHKYVKALMERIERYTNENQNDHAEIPATQHQDAGTVGLNGTASTTLTEDSATNTTSTPAQQQPHSYGQQQQRNPLTSTPVVKSSLFPPGTNIPSTLPPLPTPLVNNQNNVAPSTLLHNSVDNNPINPWSWFSQPKQHHHQQQPLGVNTRMESEEVTVAAGAAETVSPTTMATMDSAFDFNNDVHLYDLFKFADFVYTPTMDPHTNNGTDSNSNSISSSKNHHSLPTSSHYSSSSSTTYISSHPSSTL
ncbi:hypothetical protein BCR42DRAFT_450253 [Absidia repens]|uniref:Zn(2)-C6 fungal-type domain-containing protein n=1 Tax=Absidia repens TaxID=90262 RepID=A0A1X2IJG0_9FUNG|nr:hypothetical protein BCR42DRAFT_450253 [Absidia repens]